MMLDAAQGTLEEEDYRYTFWPGNCLERKELAVAAGRSRFLFDAMLGLSHQYGKSTQKRRSPSVMSWALGLEKVLDDAVGLNTFKEFLEREFSAENIMFWIVCEQYRSQFDKLQRKKLAKEIVERHLRHGATEAINIDSHTRQNAIEGMYEAPQDLFVSAQKQIFNLMKFDCYQRFLKSDLFTCSLTAEKLGKPLPFQENIGSKSPKKCRSRSKSRDRNRLLSAAKINRNLSHENNIAIENNVSSKCFNENNSPTNSGENSPQDELDEKRRKSLLPWQKGTARAKSTEPERSDSRSPVLRERSSNSRRSKRKTAEKKHSGEIEKNDMRSSNNKLEISEKAQRVSFEEKFGRHLRPPQGNEEQRNKYRLISPDQMIQNTERNKPVSNEVSSMLVNRDASEPPPEAPSKDTTRVADLTPSAFSDKEFIKHPAIIRLELPSKKVIAVKAEPTQTCTKVLEPVLRKYGIDISNVTLYFDGSVMPLNMNGEIQIADRCKICMTLHNSLKDSEIYRTVTAQLKNNRERKDVTSRMLEEIVKGKICFYYDELGILDLENSDVKYANRPNPTDRSSANEDTPRRNSFTTCKDDKSKPRSLYSKRASIHEGMGINIQLNETVVPQDIVNTTPRRSMPKNVHYRDSCDLTAVWNRAQKQLDDQRGLELNYELPEFLRLRSDSSPAKFSSMSSK